MRQSAEYHFVTGAAQCERRTTGEGGGQPHSSKVVARHAVPPTRRTHTCLECAPLQCSAMTLKSRASARAPANVQTSGRNPSALALAGGEGGWEVERCGRVRVGGWRKVVGGCVWRGGGGESNRLIMVHHGRSRREARSHRGLGTVYDS